MLLRWGYIKNHLNQNGRHSKVNWLDNNESHNNLWQFTVNSRMLGKPQHAATIQLLHQCQSSEHSNKKVSLDFEILWKLNACVCVCVWVSYLDFVVLWVRFIWMIVERVTLILVRFSIVYVVWRLFSIQWIEWNGTAASLVCWEKFSFNLTLIIHATL